MPELSQGSMAELAAEMRGIVERAYATAARTGAAMDEEILIRVRKNIEKERQANAKTFQAPVTFWQACRRTLKNFRHRLQNTLHQGLC